jgi:hypothetical protein
VTTPRLIRPPRFVTWLATLFAYAERECIEGDLFEEFSALVSHSGTAAAKRWYWRQALKSIVHLFCSAFSTAPYSTTAAIMGGFLLGRLLFPLPEKGVFAVLERYRVFDHHFDVYVFFATNGIAMAHVLTSMLVGCLTAFAAKRNGMIAVVSLVFIHFGMTCAATFVSMARGNASMAWAILPWIFLDWLAMLVGALIVRHHTSASRTLSSRT